MSRQAASFRAWPTKIPAVTSWATSRGSHQHLTSQARIKVAGAAGGAVSPSRKMTRATADIPSGYLGTMFLVQLNTSDLNQHLSRQLQTDC